MVATIKTVEAQSEGSLKRLQRRQNLNMLLSRDSTNTEVWRYFVRTVMELQLRLHNKLFTNPNTTVCGTEIISDNLKKEEEVDSTVPNI